MVSVHRIGKFRRFRAGVVVSKIAVRIECEARKERDSITKYTHQKGHSRVRVSFFIMMEGITVEKYDRIRRNEHALIDEVIDRAMRSCSPKWGMNTEDLK